MALTKPRGGWHYEDLFGLPDDGRRYEIVDGELYEMPAPGEAHANAFANLFLLLGPVVRALGGRIFGAPIDVFLPGANPIQPDILVLLPDRLHLRSERGIEGPPSLVIEILSPSNPERDQLLKRDLYARAGVPEYWLADPRTKEIEVLVYRDGSYRTMLLARSEETVTSSVVPGISFPVSAAFA